MQIKPDPDHSLFDVEFGMFSFRFNLCSGLCYFISGTLHTYKSLTPATKFNQQKKLKNGLLGRESIVNIWSFLSLFKVHLNVDTYQTKIIRNESWKTVVLLTITAKYESSIFRILWNINKLIEGIHMWSIYKKLLNFKQKLRPWGSVCVCFPNK